MTIKSSDTYTRHDCGGTILLGGSGDESHYYCDRCHAFSYDTDKDMFFPTGTDEAVNHAAYDAGDFCSPDAADVEPRKQRTQEELDEARSQYDVYR